MYQLTTSVERWRAPKSVSSTVESISLACTHFSLRRIQHLVFHLFLGIVFFLQNSSYCSLNQYRICEYIQIADCSETIKWMETWREKNVLVEIARTEREWNVMSRNFTTGGQNRDPKSTKYPTNFREKHLVIGYKQKLGELGFLEIGKNYNKRSHVRTTCHIKDKRFDWDTTNIHLSFKYHLEVFLQFNSGAYASLKPISLVIFLSVFFFSRFRQ